MTHLLATTLFVQNRLRDGCAVLEQARSATAASQMHFIDSLAATAASAACWDQDRDAAVQLLRDGTYRRAARHLFLRSRLRTGGDHGRARYGIETNLSPSRFGARKCSHQGGRLNAGRGPSAFTCLVASHCSARTVPRPAMGAARYNKSRSPSCARWRYSDRAAVTVGRWHVAWDVALMTR